MKTRSSAIGNPLAGQVSNLSFAMRQVGNQSHGRGLTLIEVLLVLAILVIFASFIWPAISTAFSNQVLLKAADKIRMQWGKARVAAMNSGQVVLFRYELNGGKFRLDHINDANSFDDSSNRADFPENESPSNESPSNESPSNSVDSTSNAVAGNDSPYSKYLSAKDVNSLPSKVVFLVGTIENDSRTTALNVDSSIQNDGANWSPPIFFYPDGTTSNARLQISNERNRVIELSLRGMTGVVKVGEISSGGTSP
jgi:prepilin-type N-terminal cleavage/methylation domain-containing protein